MGKKSKKGVSRAGTKKHNAAGHGKSAASASTTTKGRSRSDSKASYESGSSNNAFNVQDASISQNFAVNAKEQPTVVSSNVSGEIQAILDVLNKENNAAPGVTMQTMMADVEKILISPPRMKNVVDSPKEETAMDAPVSSPPNEVPTLAEEKVAAVETVETPMKAPEPILEKVEVAEDPPVEKVEEIATTLVESVVDIGPPPAILEPPVIVEPAVVVPDSVEVDDQPLFCVSNNPVDADSKPIEPTKEEEVAPAPDETPVSEAKSGEPMNVWSSKLRDAVSLMDTDDMANQPPVLDVTPVKQPSKLVPVIQTVSPSPDTSKHIRSAPTLDTPDAKDVEVKQNECGCIIV